MTELGNGFVGSPADNPTRATSRFAVELAAWVLGPWAASRTSGATAVVVLLILILGPAVFNVPGDKRVTVIPTPGGVRVAIELVLYATAAGAGWSVTPRAVAGAISAAVLVATVVQIPRWRWLLREADQASVAYTRRRLR